MYFALLAMVGCFESKPEFTPLTPNQAEAERVRKLKGYEFIRTIDQTTVEEWREKLENEHAIRQNFCAGAPVVKVFPPIIKVGEKIDVLDVVLYIEEATPYGGNCRPSFKGSGIVGCQVLEQGKKQGVWFLATLPELKFLPPGVDCLDPNQPPLDNEPAEFIY